MLSISEVCDLYAWLYTGLPVPASTFDHVIPVDGCYVAIKNVGGIDYVLFRGSVTVLDWIEDFTRVAQPFHDPQLGIVHPGFMLGVRAVQAKIDALVGNNVIVVGHSLGAGHAQLYAGYRAAAGKSVNRLLLFGSPRAGGPELSKVLAPVDIYSFCNGDQDGHDLVTDVPYSLGKLLPYCHPRELQKVTYSPPADDVWALFRYHHFGLYCRALHALGTAATSLPI